MKVNWNTGLVLEGGGMRGVFTSGVLDGFMKHDVYFHYVVAVSAGAWPDQVRRSRMSPRKVKHTTIPAAMAHHSAPRKK